VTLDAAVQAVLQRAFPGAAIESATALEGGISARAVEVQLIDVHGSRQRVVVRRPNAATTEDGVRVVNNEYRVLSHCLASGVAVPVPRFLDAAVAAVVLDFVEGRPDFSPGDVAAMLRQMARALAQIHAVSVQPVAFLGRTTVRVERNLARVPAQLDDTLDESRLRAVLGALWPFEQHNPDVLLHGDFWPGNLLWHDGELRAVLDWEEAEIGDPLADVALTRLDVLWAFGAGAMDEFTRYYAAEVVIDWRNLAYWDLCVALRPMSAIERWASVYPLAPIHRPDITAESMRAGHREFVRQALAALGEQP
jgi:aminoglycoside phosphotransferase (APT) family kinase protein